MSENNKFCWGHIGTLVPHWWEGEMVCPLWTLYGCPLKTSAEQSQDPASLLHPEETRADTYTDLHNPDPGGVIMRATDTVETIQAGKALFK